MQPNYPDQQQPSQYGAPPPPGQPWPQQYYPPPKQGMPGWAWVLIGCGGLAVVFIIVGILALAAIPLVTSNTRDARRAEGEQMMGTARNQARVAYSRTGRPVMTLTGDAQMGGAGVSAHDLIGRYYTVNDAIRSLGSDQAELSCVPNQSTDGVGRTRFSWNQGGYDIRWE